MPLPLNLPNKLLFRKMHSGPNIALEVKGGVGGGGRWRTTGDLFHATEVQIVAPLYMYVILLRNVENQAIS